MVEAAQDRKDRLTGATRERVTGTDTPLTDAVRIALALEVTAPAVAVKVAEVEPAGTVTDGGTVRVGLLEDTATVAPPVGAVADSVTVQEVLVLEARLEAVQCREVGVTGASTEMMRGSDVPLREAVMVAPALGVMAPEVGVAVAVKPAEVEPAGIVTDSGTLRVGLFEDRVTTRPPAGAALDSVTVQ